MIDTHCHLNDPQFDADREEAVHRAIHSDVTGLLVVGYTIESCQKALELESHQGISIALGLHPDSADKLPSDWLEELKSLIKKSSRLAAIGEIGLDFYWHKKEESACQFEVFRTQIKLAQEMGLPVSIHSREAVDEVMDTLEETGIPEAGAVLHAFTGTPQQAERATNMGLYVGAGGIATFKKADSVRDALKIAGLGRILLETDCPYLAPTPHRGKRNEPAYLPLIAQSVASLFDVSLQTVLETTTENARRVFAKMV